MIEHAVMLLLVEAPTGWTHLHAEFEPSSPGAPAAASATTPDGHPSPMDVPAEVLENLAEHQHRAAAAGAPWRRLILDCHSDGRLAVRTEPAKMPALRRSLVLVLTALTVGCLVAAAVVFAVDWRWGPPPRVEVAALPDPPPRQKETFAVISRWIDAENHADVARMRTLICTHPAPSVLSWLSSLQDYGQRQGLLVLDAVTRFRDAGSQVWVTVAVRVRPLSESQQQEVAAAQQEGGFFADEYTLDDDGTGLKVCDLSVVPG
ncbi:hypothetical protein AOT85_06250 [Mycobacteroides sp. H054]|nr:hypothetical protein AOT85_06250 [Mycobacteroides sp. H054]